jgi:hypothetical protein
MKANKIDNMLKGFVNSYLGTASWVTCDSGECTDFTREAKKQALNDCKQFVDKVFSAMDKETAERVLNRPGSDLENLAGHDFFLTRNRHGAGFWDKEDVYGVNEAKILTDISHEMKEANCTHIRGIKSKLIFE